MLLLELADILIVLSLDTYVYPKKFQSSRIYNCGVKIHQKRRFVQSKHFHYTCLNTTVGNAPQDQRVPAHFLIDFHNVHVTTFH